MSVQVTKESGTSVQAPEGYWLIALIRLLDQKGIVDKDDVCAMVEQMGEDAKSAPRIVSAGDAGK